MKTINKFHIRQLCKLLVIGMGILFPINTFGEKKVFVSDLEDNPISGATVSVLSLPDSIPVAAALTDSKGFASLPDPGERDVISVKAFGYLPLISSYANIGNTIKLTAESKSLNEVVVTAHTQSLKRVGAKYVFNPGSLRSEVTNAFDLLKWTPLLSTTQDDVSILGSGTGTIYINGRIPLEGQEGAIEMLKSTRPGNIKRIEVLPMAGSSIDASSSRGIVNVVIDDPAEGWRGSIRSQTDYATERFSPNEDIWLYYSSGKFRTSINGMYVGQAGKTAEDARYLYGESGKSISNKSRGTSWKDVFRLNWNVTYDLSKKSIMGASLTLREKKSHSNLSVLTNTLENGITNNSTSSIHTKSPFTRPDMIASAFYELKAGPKGSLLEIRADYSNLNSKSDKSLLFDDYLVEESYRNRRENSRAKADYTLKINDRHKFKTGYNFSFSDIKYSKNSVEDQTSFRYREQIHGAYAELSSTWSDRFYSSLGVRMEHADSKGLSIVDTDNFRRKETDLFPTLRLGMSIPSGNQNISVGVTRSIRRPAYSWLDPYKYWTSDNTYSVGNPDLKSQYSWELNTTYSFLKNFAFVFLYTHSNNDISEYTYMDGDHSVTSYANIGIMNRYIYLISFSRQLFPFWYLKTDLGLYDEHSRARNQLDKFNYNKANISWSFMSDFSISKRYGWTMAFYFNMRSPSKDPLMDFGWTHSLNAEFSKTFKNRLSLNLILFNLTNFKNNWHYNSLEYSATHRKMLNPMACSLTLRYTFGKRKIRSAKTLSQSEMKERDLDI